MNTFYGVLGAVAMAIIVFFMFRNIKNNPQWFTKESLSKAFSSMGVLALILIVFIGFLVMMLNT